MTNPDILHGLVLSGGESRRMGRDKGLIPVESTLWVNRAGTLLQEVDLPVSILIREVQRKVYTAEILPDFELLSDLDLPVGGPLKGLLSFHLRYPQADVLVLPCDMPNLTVGLLRKLMVLRAKVPEAEAWVFMVQDCLQPFPGIFSARLLAAVSQKMYDGYLTRHGLVQVLASAKTASEVVEDEFAFRNLNSPADL
ncbi:molybdenum cofactor guanylyltransferase [Salmonirosea aquatica]|uniref:NTP transferase domain-containing protein n=1 Tax=Salmonirosea aquatica TaxID=2654236 RepID=A0A7C9FPU7_9BACT|nr:NTP transferase domain-containing protein [Cytophagaceae bacterium SJW1-29]